MRPAYEREDWLVATRRGRVRVGSVVVIEHPGRAGFELIKRVAAVPPGRTDAAHGAYWVVGDNPDASTDSRAFGMIRRSAVRGVVRFRYGPPARAGMRPPPSPAGRPEDPPYGR
jgi:type IV secretory pathway protease TraF